jgi:hypothetical protein
VDYFNGAMKDNVGGWQRMEVLLGHNMCIVAELNHLGRHMWLSEVKSEEDGMNLQMEANPVEDVEAAEYGIVLHKAATRAK